MGSEMGGQPAKDGAAVPFAGAGIYPRRGACGSWRRARSPALHGKATGQQGRETAVNRRLRADEDHRPLRKGGGSLQALRQPQCFPAGRSPAQGTISGSYTGAARRGASETPPAGGSARIVPPGGPCRGITVLRCLCQTADCRAGVHARRGVCGGSFGRLTPPACCGCRPPGAARSPWRGRRSWCGRCSSWSGRWRRRRPAQTAGCKTGTPPASAPPAFCRRRCRRPPSGRCTCRRRGKACPSWSGSRRSRWR